MKVSWALTGVAVTLTLTACGGSHHRSQAHLPGKAPPIMAPASTTSLVLPASTAGPTTCTVYESGFGTQVIFDSESLNVSPECQAWISRQPGAGYLWAYQPTSAAIDATAVSICDLSDPSGRVTATVIEDTGFAPVSAFERQVVGRACTSLVDAGWVKATARAS